MVQIVKLLDAVTIVGPAGPQGPEGPPGSGGDKNFTQDFLLSDTVEVNHNLGKLVSVTVVDSAGDEVIGAINYVDANNIIVSFIAVFSGKIVCN